MTPSLPNQPDDLTVIKGIKESRQHWLRETFHIRTYGDLAALSADKIHAQLPVGQIISRQQIEAWIQQARHLSSASQPHLQLPKQEGGWQPYASFVVEFQKRENHPEETRTRIHYMEADKDATWPNAETQALGAWIATQLEAIQSPAFSPRLQRILAKIQPAGSKSQRLAQETEKDDETRFNEKLQEAIAKSQSLMSHRN